MKKNKTIIINEHQLRLLSEGVGFDDIQRSLAVWCLCNDFRFYNPNALLGDGYQVANDGGTNKYIAELVMNGNIESYGDDYTYKVTFPKTEDGDSEIYIFIEDELDSTYADRMIDRYESGDIENENLGWFINYYG
jgi:hypothetical protein